MAKQGISTGTTPNDGTGDTLVVGAVKVNANFKEIYDQLGDGNNLTAVIGSGIATAGGTVGTGATILDFRGSGISTVTVSSGIATINITGGGGGSSYSDSDVDTHLNTTSASASEVLSWTGTDYDWVAQSGGGISSVFEDTTPQLGGNLVLNSKDITGTGNMNVTGVITATSFGGSAANMTNLTGASAATYGDASNSAQITVDANGRITGITNVAISGGGGGISSVFEDTSPQLGGNLDLNSKDITGIGSMNVTGVVTATSFSGNGSDVSRQWTLGADGTSNYTFTGPGLTGAENDPTLYLTRGQQYQFVNNMGAHPFRIQSTPNGSTGTQYNDGITNNDVSNGTLTWDVQFDAPNILYYQCTAHPNMGGPIYIVPRTEPAVGVRDVVSGTTGSVGAATTTNLDITGFKSYGLLKVGISSAAWVRLYVDEASRTSDANRSYLVDPTPGSGLIAEVRAETTGSSTFLMTPGVIGWNNDVSVGSTIYTAVTNNEGSSATITVDLTVVKMED